MDTRLLKKLRNMSAKAYGVERRGSRYTLVSYTSCDKSDIKEYNNKAEAIVDCDELRWQFVYSQCLNMRAANNHHIRVY